MDEVYSILPYIKQSFYKYIYPTTILEIEPVDDTAKNILADGIAYHSIPDAYSEDFMGYADMFVCLNIEEEDINAYWNTITFSMGNNAALLLIRYPVSADPRKAFKTKSAFSVLLSDGRFFSAMIIERDF